MVKQNLQNDFYKKLFKKFDKGLISTLDHFNKTMTVSIEKVEKRLKVCERVVYNYITKTRKDCETDLSLAEVLVNKELRSKNIMSQWTNKFLASSDETSLDPVSFALSRLCLNVCLSFQDIHPLYLLEVNVHKHLVDYISVRSEIIIGPALMALVHISLFPEVKAEVVAAGALPVLLRIMVHSKSKPILTQAVKLCASLALENSNKPLLSQSGCMHAMLDLVLGTHVEVDEHIQFATLCAVVNTTSKNDANRMLAVELNGIRPILTVLRTSSNDSILTQAVYALANIAFGNPYTANCILVGGGGEVLMELLQSGDIMRQPVVAHAVLSALSNMCNSEGNQAHIGSISGLVECVIRVCDHAREVFLVTAAANLVLACCWRNAVNKVGGLRSYFHFDAFVSDMLLATTSPTQARFANKGGCTALVKRLIRHATVPSPDHVCCAEKLCSSLSSVLLYGANHERMTGADHCPLPCMVLRVLFETVQ